ncbi:B-4DMT family transporter [Rhodococcus sp. NM-2]|uniref:B-4DMT family transporter n=1 Tax=Rhodococcus sp. NM-2 TaxID=3401174 RepID=UPI003AAA4470
MSTLLRRFKSSATRVQPAGTARNSARRRWLIRGLVLAVVHVLVRAAMGVGVTNHPSSDSALRLLAIGAVVVVALVWGILDGICKGRDSPSAQNADLTIIWLEAAAVAAVLAGVLAWIVGQATSIGVGRNSLFFEATSGAAFTLMLIFAPAVAGSIVGHYLTLRNTKGQKVAAVSQNKNVEYLEDFEYLEEEIVDHSYEGPHQHHR